MTPRVLLAHLGIDPKVDCILIFKPNRRFATWRPQAATDMSKGVPIHSARMLAVCHLLDRLDLYWDEAKPIFEVALRDWIVEGVEDRIPPTRPSTVASTTFSRMLHKLQVVADRDAVIVLKPDSRFATHIPEADRIRDDRGTEAAHLYLAIGIAHMIRETDRYHTFWDRLLEDALPGFEFHFPTNLPVFDMIA
jgi:hypothetical protein